MSAHLLLCVATAGAVLLQKPPATEIVFQGERVTVTEGKLTASGDEALGPAKICLAPSAICFTAPPNNAPFGFEPEAAVVSLLVVRNGRLINLLPDVRVTSGDYKIWRAPGVSDSALLTVVEAVWDIAHGETRFADHRYRIRTLTFEPAQGNYSERYVVRDEYVTSPKYSAEDESILDHEKENVLARLRRRK